MIKTIITALLCLALTNTWAGNNHKKPKKKTQNQPQVEQAYIIQVLDTGEILDAKNNDVSKPLASITKLMTTYVVLEAGQDLNEDLTITDVSAGSKRLRRGMRLSRSELIDLALVSSDNVAAQTLCNNYPGGYIECLIQMNLTAYRLGMRNTKFEEPTGLSANNISTANDIILLDTAITKYPAYSEAAMSKFVRVTTTVQQRIRRTWRTVETTITGHNTNSFAGEFDIRAAKTGFTSHAGRCLTMVYTMNGRQYALAILGARDQTQRRRIAEALLSKHATPEAQQITRDSLRRIQDPETF